MKNKPMTSNEHFKLFIFFLLLIPTILLLVGIIPVLFLGFGIYMMKKNKDFSYIDTAVEIFKSYTWLVFVGLVVLTMCIFADLRYDEKLIMAGIAGIPYAYIIMVHYLFFAPMNAHREWVEVNGIFLTKPKSEKNQTNQQI